MSAPETNRIYWFAEVRAFPGWYIATERCNGRLTLTTNALAAMRFDSRERCAALIEESTIQETVIPVEHMFMGSMPPSPGTPLRGGA